MKKIGSFPMIAGAAALWAFAAAPASAQVRVFLDSVKKAEVAPAEVFQGPDVEGEEDIDVEESSAGLQIEVSPGEIFQVPVFIADGEEDVVSYCLRVLYHKKMLKILEISGGTFEGFAEPPLTNHATFESGKTDFIAHSATFLSTPDSFNVALINFEVIGRPGQKSAIRIRKTPRTDITVLQTFGPAKRVRFQKGITVRVK